MKPRIDKRIVDVAACMFSDYNLKPKQKKDSVIMKIIAWFLNTFGILDSTKFMTRYTTTLFGNVYLCYLLGDVNQRGYFSQLSMIAHECTHARQRKEHPVLFPLAYIFSLKRRAQYEMEAYETSIQTYYGMIGYTPNPKHYAERLVDYGCGKHLEMVEEYYKGIISYLDNKETYTLEALMCLMYEEIIQEAHQKANKLG